MDASVTGNIAVAISMVSAIVSFISVFFVWRQTRLQKNTIRSQLSTDLIMKVYSDYDLQKVLYLVFDDRIEFNRTGDTAFVIIIKGKNDDIAQDVDKLLNIFQIIGNLLFTKALDKDDIRGLGYEIISLGRNEAIYKYLQFLINDYQKISGVSHDHFLYFKKLYLSFEYDKQCGDKIRNCILSA